MGARKSTTVRVMVHLAADGTYAVGVVTSEWQGAVKVSRRLARLRPVMGPPPRPMGVDPDVWRAHCALTSLVAEQRTEAP